MDLKLKNKTALITGSTAGIGLESARQLALEGASIIVQGRSTNSVDSAIRAIQSSTPEVDIDGMVLDFSTPINDLGKQLERLKIDILVNNVGIYESKDFFETTDQSWYTQFEVNVMSGVRLSRLLLPQMLKRNWGRIIFVSSECAQLVPSDLIAYSTTKAAILALSRGLAQLTTGTQVTVNTVIPGSTKTEGAQKFLSEVAKERKMTIQEVEQDFFSTSRTTSLLQRFASVEEVANLITYLVSPISSATNGAAIKVDGGSVGGIL